MPLNYKEISESLWKSEQGTAAEVAKTCHKLFPANLPDERAAKLMTLLQKQSFIHGATAALYFVEQSLEATRVGRNDS